MRILLLHNRIYRAFPELDRYTDERCQKFINAARRGRVRRFVHAWVILAVAALVLVGGLVAAGWVIEHWPRGIAVRSSVALDLAIILIGVCAAPFAGYLTRDWLLRRRVRYVLRTRGACSGCRYSLIGLPVGAACTVRCPECGLESEVDPALGELVLDESGMARFRPPPPRLPRFFTPPRVRIIKRIAIVAALLIGVGLPALWGGYELWLRRQAATALAEKPGAAALLTLVNANQPPGSEGEANAWDSLQDALNQKGQADFWDELQNPGADGSRVYAEFTWLYLPPPPADAPEEVRQKAADGKVKALRLLEVYRQRGVYDALDRMAKAPRAVRPMSTPSGLPVFGMGIPQLGQMRELARVNAARGALALANSDLAEFTSALEANLALARVAENQPTLIENLTGGAIETGCYNRLHEFLATHPSAEWLDGVDAAIARQRVTVQPGYVWEGERLIAIDAAAWLFSDPARVRWGWASEEVETVFAQLDGPLGTYEQNRDALNTLARATAALAAQPRWTRSAIPPIVKGSELPLVKRFSDTSDMISALDRADLARAAYAVASALERYFAAKGTYPDSLAALVPDYLPQLPIDPWTGEPWGYHLRSPDAPPEDPRGYVLYSYGSDGRDDGG